MSGAGLLSHACWKPVGIAQGVILGDSGLSRESVLGSILRFAPTHPRSYIQDFDVILERPGALCVDLPAQTVYLVILISDNALAEFDLCN